jgi:hypothetical protein
MEDGPLMRLLNSDLRWYRDRLVALSVCSLVALMLAFGLLPSVAGAATSCSGLDGSQGPLFFIPSSNSDSTLTPTPASGSTVPAGSTVYAVYHDETDLGTGHNLTFTYTGPSSGTVTPIFTPLAGGTGFSTMTPADSDADAWDPGSSHHPDQEFNHVVKISGVIPNLTTAGDYTFHLQTFDGDNNSDAGDCGFAEWKLHVKAQPTIGTQASAGGPIGTVIHDTATVSGGQSPTGNVTFSLYAPGDTTCQTPLSLPDPTEPLSGSSATSDNFTTAAVGTYHWRAHYDGDDNNATAISGCESEPVVITKAQPEINTVPSDGGAVGVSISDTATLSGGHNPTGNVTFQLFAPGDTSCETPLTLPTPTEDLSGLSATSDSYNTTTVGTYHWIATYNGDANNFTATSGCQAEPVTTVPASPSISTASSDSVVVGGSISDTAHLTGGFNPTGTITFTLYGPGDTTCATPLSSSGKTVAGDGFYTSNPVVTSLAGTYRWIASYSGDANNNPASGDCNDEFESVVVTQASPAISTSASDSVVVGGQITDTAHLTGGFSPTGTITFTLYGPGDTTCATPISTTGKTVAGDGFYTSAPFTTTLAGTYRWIASYSGDANNKAVAGACNDEFESVVVTKAQGTIATVAAGANLVAGKAGLVGDSAAFVGAYHPTGNVVFTLYNADCSVSTGITGSGTISNTGTAAFSSAWTPAAAGTYSWKAAYAGDANNAAFTTGCHDANEQVTVSNAPASGTQAATTVVALPKAGSGPNIGHGASSWNLLLAALLVLLGLSGIVGQALYTLKRNDER